MRYVTTGLLVVLIIVLAQPVAADGGPSPVTVPGFDFLTELVEAVLDWLGFGAGVEPNGLDEDPPASEFGAGVEPNG